MKNMTLEHIVQAVNGQLYLPENMTCAQQTAKGVVIDNRQVEKDFIFIAIKGARVDGHTFIPDAFRKGAMAVIAEQKPEPLQGACILVKDTQQALKELAKYYREQMDAYVIGIVGSVGKTSTKEMVASVLSQHFSVLKTQGNFNNEIGLPLTLLRVREEHEVAVVEMGISDFGEMHRLGEMAKPDMVILTNIGLCHLEKLGDRDGVLKAKTEVLSHLQKDAVVLLNGDDDKLCAADTKGFATHFFGLGRQEYHATELKSEWQSVSALLIGPKWSQRVTIAISGQHNVYNALAAMAAGECLGMTQQEIVKGVEAAATIDGRNHFIEKNDITVIDDCYNANPISMRASLEVLSHAKGRKIAVLGDMGELGENEASLHYQVGCDVADYDIDCLFTLGELSKHIAAATSEKQGTTEVFSFDNREAMLQELKKYIKKGDTVLVKASHFMNFQEIVKSLTA